MTFKEYVARRDEGIKPVKYRPGAIVPTVTFRSGGPEKMSPFKAQNPSRPIRPQYSFRMGKKQTPSSIINR